MIAATIDFKDGNVALRQLAHAMLVVADYEIVPEPVKGETTPGEGDTPPAVAAPLDAAPALAAPADAPA